MNKIAKPAHPHPTASLFCVYCHNNRLTFLSILSHHTTCLVSVWTRLQNLPIHIQPPHFSVYTVTTTASHFCLFCHITQLVWFLCLQNLPIHIQPPHFSVYTVTTRDLLGSCLQNLPIHIQAPHFSVYTVITTTSLFCLYCHNTQLVLFLCEQVCKTCPSTSNRLTFLSILSQPATCSVPVWTSLQNLPIHIQPPHFSVSTELRNLQNLSLVCSNSLLRINACPSRQAVDKHTLNASGAVITMPCPWLWRWSSGACQVEKETLAAIHPQKHIILLLHLEKARIKTVHSLKYCDLSVQTFASRYLTMYKGNIHITATASLSLQVHAFTCTLCDKRVWALLFDRQNTDTQTQTHIRSRCWYMHSHVHYVTILVTTASRAHAACVTWQSTHIYSQCRYMHSHTFTETEIHTRTNKQCSFADKSTLGKIPALRRASALVQLIAYTIAEIEPRNALQQ